MEIDLGHKSTVFQTGHNQIDTGISNGDLSVSEHNIPAELARQASHLL